MASYGKAEAQLKLGEMYEDGHGTEQNFDSAEQWYQKALDQGFAPAQEKLNKLQQRRQQAANASNEQLHAEQQRLLREKAKQVQLAQEQADRARAEKELAESQKAEQDKAEKERLAREAVQQQEQDKLTAAEDERLARKRAQEAIKKMLAVPGGYEQ
jgi:septal ring factor EnvC (AmiA/AmiB activator)